jgi:hypothetical protein
MRIVCSYCEQEGKPALIMESFPLDDPSVSHTICAAHLLQLRREIARSGEIPDWPTGCQGSRTPLPDNQRPEEKEEK